MMEEMKMMEWKWIELRFENIHQWDSEFHEWFPFYYKHKLVSPSVRPLAQPTSALLAVSPADSPLDATHLIDLI